MSLDNIRRLAGIVDFEFAPWDARVEEANEKDLVGSIKAKKAKGHYAGDDISAFLKLRGFVDMGKDAPVKTYDGPLNAVRQAISIGMVQQHGKVALIRDPGSTIQKDWLEKTATEIVTGNGHGPYGAFGYDTNDGEIFADGPEVFADGQWGYQTTSAWAHAQNKELEKNPPKVTVTRVQGKTGGGWKIEVSKGLDHYDAVGAAAADKAAAELAKKGIFPNPKVSRGDSGSLAELRKKWLAKAPKK